MNKNNAINSPGRSLFPVQQNRRAAPPEQFKQRLFTLSVSLKPGFVYWSCGGKRVCFCMNAGWCTDFTVLADIAA